MESSQSYCDITGGPLIFTFPKRPEQLKENSAWDSEIVLTPLSAEVRSHNTAVFLRAIDLSHLFLFEKPWFNLYEQWEKTQAYLGYRRDDILPSSRDYNKPL